MPESDDNLPGEEALRQLWVDANNRAVEITDSMGLTDEDLEKIQDRWAGQAAGVGHPMVAMTRFVMLVRAMRVLTDASSTGAENASMSELLFRRPIEPSDN